MELYLPVIKIRGKYVKGHISPYKGRPGRWHSDLLRQKSINNLRRGEGNPGNNNASKPVLMFRNEMIIGRFASIRDASKKSGINYYKISRQCRGVMKKKREIYFKFEKTH